MPERDWRFRLQDMLDSIHAIESYTKELTKEQFLGSRLVLDAVVRNFQVIGEAARHIPEEHRKRLSMIAWQEIRDMRNKLVHDYPGIDWGIVWTTVRADLPPLKEQLEEALGLPDLK